MMVNIAVANDDVKLTASAPPSVIMGKPFQITFTANAKVTDFKAPAITNFDILAGPFKSESHSTQIINGNLTSSVSITYTFTLQAQSTGTFTIPSATITSGGKKVTSNGLSIKVLPEDDSAASTSSSSSSAASGASAAISSDNLFIRPILSKSTVYEQEAVKLTYKLYTTYDVVQFNNKSMPDFKGFLKQEFERTGNTQLAYENYNGRNFLTAVLYEVMLYPQTPERSSSIKLSLKPLFGYRAGGKSEVFLMIFSTLIPMCRVPLKCNLPRFVSKNYPRESLPLFMELLASLV